MAPGNESSVTEFILLGITQEPGLQLPLFFIFLAVYAVTVVGNVGLIILIGLNPHLHTPMYYFLFNLSFIDLCHSSVITPKMLMSFVSQNIISYAECMTQLCFFSFFVIDECCILTSMAYDRYVAICKPLLYKVSMPRQVCLMLTVGVYAMGLVGAMAHTACMLRLSFCDGNIINHYMCDIPPLLQLSCTSTSINELVVFIVVGVNVIVPSVTIFISYTLILSNILHIRSAEGRSKAFSTCSSHVIALFLFFGSAAFMYLKYSSESMDLGKISSVFYTNVVPMLNPLIYSLRNKDIKVTLRKSLFKIQQTFGLCGRGRVGDDLGE
uniref:G-protein coupled receptors family 1 profile domain-containing protein n=1 Tax=Bos indicus x Bos taurus TaxID=30522 RepID=A0A4W2BQJ0_BOBOX